MKKYVNDDKLIILLTMNKRAKIFLHIPNLTLCVKCRCFIRNELTNISSSIVIPDTISNSYYKDIIFSNDLRNGTIRNILKGKYKTKL